MRVLELLELLDVGRKPSQIEGFNGQVSKKTSPRPLIWTMQKHLDSTPLLDMEEACSVMEEEQRLQRAETETKCDQSLVHTLFTC